MIFRLILPVLVFVSLLFLVNDILYKSPVDQEAIDGLELIVEADGTRRVGANWLRLNEHGNYECYIEGNGYQRGQIQGKLMEDLLKEQEVYFIDEVERHVPSSFFRRILSIFISLINNDLDELIPLEFRQEIYGVSKYFSDDYDYIGPKYNRIINYHAAHDIGHAMQNLHLVGCTVVGECASALKGERMIIGRNFDFYVGENFASNKMILFSNPDSGYNSISVSWPGFAGVVSGLNEMGLGIMLNSDKTNVRISSGTPVSIVARDVLQYASTIEEARAICSRYQTMVSESFVISSAIDGAFAVIEKTPDQSGVYEVDSGNLIVTNHFQSKALKNLPINMEHMNRSETVPRYNRAAELLESADTIDVVSLVEILRDQKGQDELDIGYGNPMAINQLIAHHSIIFDNRKLIAWLGSPPYQLGEYVAYNISGMEKWGPNGLRDLYVVDSLAVEPDEFLETETWKNVIKFRKMHQKIAEDATDGIEWTTEQIDEYLLLNPEYYESYLSVANYYWSRGESNEARIMYERALKCEIPYMEVEEFIAERLLKIENND
jgi:isopenicillin-N N-acyltransferase-like protein